MVHLSAIIITLNEERIIGRCIESLKDVADEVIVVDSLSTDRTAEIARDLGAKVILRGFTGYGAQKKFAEDQATHEWVISLDADEALSPALRESLMKMKQGPEHDAYKVNILTNYCGQWIWHSGWYPQAKIKCWNRQKASSNTDMVHEGISLLGAHTKVGHLKGDMLHYSFVSISEHIKKIELYTEKGARFDVARGKRCSLLKLVVGPKWKFFQDYILRLGFLDGYYGFIVCKNSAFATFVKYSKIREYSKPSVKE
jgi:glycosyltransferase involved in cell wall biosynthesis